MSGLNRQFTRFILKTIVKGVVPRKSPQKGGDLYQLMKIDLDNATLAAIKAEGAKYGLSEQDAVNELRLADEKVIFNPSLTRDYTSRRVGHFKVGERFDLIFEHPELGECVLALLATGRHEYMVIESSVGGLVYRDMVYPLHSSLNMGHPMFFDVERDGKRITTDKWCLSPGKLKYIERHTPAAIFDILDADTDYRHDGKNVKPEQKPTDKKAGRKEPDLRKNNEPAPKLPKEAFHVSFPQEGVPMEWTVAMMKESGPGSPFIITPSGNKATIEINPKFRFSPTRSVRVYETTRIRTCCTLMAGIPANFDGFETRVPGIVSYDPDRKVWKLDRLPVVSPRPGVDARMLKILRSAFLKEMGKEITTADFDTPLSTMGASVPEVMGIVINMEQTAKVAITVPDPDAIHTPRDLYNLLRDARKR